MEKSVTFQHVHLVIYQLQSSAAAAAAAGGGGCAEGIVCFSSTKVCEAFLLAVHSEVLLLLQSQQRQVAALNMARLFLSRVCDMTGSRDENSFTIFLSFK